MKTDGHSGFAALPSFFSRFLLNDTAFLRKIFNCGKSLQMNYDRKSSSSAILSNSMDQDETAVTGNFEVPRFEFVAKIELVPFLATLVTIFAQNLEAT